MISYRNISKTIWLFSLFIMATGLITLYSASYNNSRVGRDIFYDQMWCAFLAIAVMFILSRLDYRKFFDIAYILYAVNFLLLVWTDFGGRSALGATRWVNVGGISFQPSELTKLTIILMLGRYLSQRRPRLSFTLSSRLILMCPRVRHCWHIISRMFFRNF